MGKYIIVPNISYESDNLGTLLGINVNELNGKAIIIHNADFSNNNLGQVTFINEPVGPTGEIEPVGPTGETEPVGPTGETEPEEPNYSTMYFTIESLEDNNTISTGKGNNCSINPVIYYSIDNGETWIERTSSTTISTINAGDKLLLKSINVKWAKGWNTFNKIKGTKNFKVYGNIMSLLNGDNFISNSEFNSDSESSFNLAGLFYDVTTLTDASNLVFPALTLKESCYNGMFRGCSNLVYGPKLLPALDVPKDGYSSMFEGCVSLIEGPEISATTVSGATALNRMFCMSRGSKVTAAMTKSPILRITNPSSYSNVYQQLFAGNGNIAEVTILAQGTNLSFNIWLDNISGGGVIKKLSTTTLSSGASGVPSNWTTQDIDI